MRVPRYGIKGKEVVITMNKKTRSFILVYGIVFLVCLLAFLIIPFHKNAASWIVFAFSLISIAAGCGISLFAFRGEKTLVSKVYGFPVFRIGLIYVILQLAFSLIICIVAAFVDVPYWIALLGSILFAAVAGIGVIATNTTREHMEKMDTETETSTRTIKTFRVDLSALVDRCQDPTVKKELEKLSEAFQYSDPVSSPETEAIELELNQKLDQLRGMSGTAATEDFLAQIREISNTLAHRNRVCKMSKR